MSISYELAKKMKEAGFPANMERVDEEWFTYKPFFPTLEEVINACNPESFDEFGILTGYTDKWMAYAKYIGHFSQFDKFDDGSGLNVVDIQVKGSTPIEAVCRLWLELNKK